LIGAARIKLEAKDGVILQRDQIAPSQRDFWVIACGKEKNCAPRALVCDGDDLDAAPQPTRTRSAVEISISFQPPECVCGCRAFDAKAKPQTLSDEADSLIDIVDRQATTRANQKQLEYGCGPDWFGCHREHYTNPDCPADCGCGTACACGCCVLLAWVHWRERDKDWRVLHNGVRRFVRPCLMNDPIVDGRPTDEGASDGRSDAIVGVRDSEPAAVVAEPAIMEARDTRAKEDKSSGAQRKGKATQPKPVSKPGK
jgi:hypothetical protein